jgi:hypothetical protein
VACGVESWRFGGPNTYLEHARKSEFSPMGNHANEVLASRSISNVRSNSNLWT